MRSKGSEATQVGRYWSFDDGRILPVIGGAETPPATPPTDPPTTDPTDPPADPPAPPAPAPADPTDPVARADAEVAKAYDKLRQKERELSVAQKKIKEHEDAEKSEVERAQAERDEAKADADKTKTELRRALLTVELNRPEYEIAPDAVDLVADSLDRDGAIEYGEDGKARGVKDAVTRLLETRPSLRARPNDPGRTSPANPPSQRTDPPELTTEDARALAKSDPEKFNRLYEEGKIPQDALAGKT